MIPQEFEFVTTALPIELLNALRRVNDAIAGRGVGKNEEAPGAPVYVLQVHNWKVEPDATGRIQVQWHYSDAELQRKADELERSGSPFSNTAGAFRELVAIQVTIHPTSSKGTCLVEVFVPLSKWRVVVGYWQALRDGLGELYPEFRPGYVAPVEHTGKGGPGRPTHPHLDEAFVIYREGGFTDLAMQNARAKYYELEKIKQPNSSDREAFRKAMKRREKADKKP